MSAPEPGSLLIHAPVGRHFAQFHGDVHRLADSVALFVEAGSRQGAAVIVIATSANTELFLERLSRTDLAIETLRKSGQLSFHDALTTLTQFMKAGMPEWTEFKRVMTPILDSARAFGQGAPRAYGEMVSVLWRSGQHEAAIRLEEYWNDLARLHPFSLFCGYLLDTYDESTYTAPLQEIGRTHECVIPSEDDERLRVSLEAASKDIFGVSLPELVGFSTREDSSDRGLPIVQRTMLWIVRNMPTSGSAVLQRARHYYEKT